MLLEQVARDDELLDLRGAFVEPVTSVAACVKYFASEMVWRVADAAVQVHGGNGYMQDYRVEQFLRDVRLYRLYEGTSQIQRLVIAKEMLMPRQAVTA